MTEGQPHLTEADQNRLDAMKRHGECAPETARRTVLYFYPLDEGAPASDRFNLTQSAAIRALKEDWRVSLQNETILALETDADLAPATITQRHSWALGFAEANALSFDGWECEIIHEEAG